MFFLITSTSLWLVVWLCFTSNRQRGHLETAPHLLFLAKDVKPGKYTVPTWNGTLGRRVAVYYQFRPPIALRASDAWREKISLLRYRCATQAPLNFVIWISVIYVLQTRVVTKIGVLIYTITLFRSHSSLQYALGFYNPCLNHTTK